jgi:branched-chain amino acid transport system substrate-binding protein
LEEHSQGTRFQYKILFEDDQGQLKNTASAARKLLSVDKVDAITSMWSNQGQVVGPIAEKAKRPHVACAWDKSVTRSKTTVNLSATPDYFMGEYLKALEQRGIHRLNVIELNDSGSISAHDELERQARGTSVKIVKRQRFNSGDRDFRSLLTLARTQPSDAVYVNAGSPELEILAKQIHEMQFNTPLTTIGCFDFTTNLGLFEGDWYMTMTWPSEDFIRRFKARFNRDIIYQLGNFYDMVALLIESFEASPEAEGPSPEGALRYLIRLKEFNGLLGKVMVDEAHAFQSKPTFFKIENGKRVKIDG